MNWYKNIKTAFFDKTPEIANPEDVGYHPNWGEHHGPVSFVPDRWNYGQKGYNEPPMPLPKKLYHVTPFPDKISAEGFKTFRDPKEQTFGGHGTYVSFTTLGNAYEYQKGLKDMVLIANGLYEWQDRYDLAKKWGLDEKKAQHISEDVERWSQEGVIYNTRPPWDDNRKLAEFLKTSTVYGSKFPLFFGSPAALLQRLATVDPKNVAILEVETTPQNWHSGINADPDQMKGNYTYNKGETEWRIWDPAAIDKTKIRRIANIKEAMPRGGMYYTDIGHDSSDLDQEGIFLYVIDNGRFVSIPSEGPYFNHDDHSAWKYIEFNTKGRIDTKKKEASIGQWYNTPLEQRKLQEREKQIAIDGIHKNFGNDIKIHYFNTL